jgi:hypothetical protein
VIAFGVAMDDPEAYRRYAMPGIERAIEPDSEVFAIAASERICRSYNLLLDTAARREDLEALVLVRQDLELDDPGFCDKLRAALAQPDVGVVGCVGATGVTSIAWWDGAVVAAPALHRYNEHGSGELPALSWLHPADPPAEVDTVDGSLFALSPWAVRNVRFDEALVHGYGADLDYCLQVREAGRKVAVADLRTVLHRPLPLVLDREHGVWVEAHIAVAEKWGPELDGRNAVAPNDWKARARRAEAEREAARTMAYSSSSELDAQILPLEHALGELTGSAAWRLTRPLRDFNVWRAQRRRG